jgi:hypothetical protein
MEHFSVKEFRVRFLYPFFFERQQLEKAISRLVGYETQRFKSIWEPGEPHEHYRDDVLSHVTNFLFGDGTEGNSPYLKINNDMANSLFHRAVVKLRETDIHIKLVKNAGIELFLTRYGVGVLSISVSPQANSLDSLIEFNYRMSQMPPIPCAAIHIPHPMEDKERWEHIPAVAREKISPPLPDDAALNERLGVPGGSFILTELVEVLLAPLHEIGFRPVQQNFSVYTSVLFGSEMDLEQAELRTQFGPILSKLAQVEEVYHAGAISEDLPVANGILNRRHWAAAGHLGAAHLLADQPPISGKGPHPFNVQRVPRVFLKYFIPYLIALIQRLALHRFVEDAMSALLSNGQDSKDELDVIRSDILQFSVGGHFTQISVRDALHRFYQISRQGLDVTTAWDEARRAITEIDTKHSTLRQEKHSEAMAVSLGITAHTQTLIEWIEVFIVSVYAGELYHMSAEYAEGGIWEHWSHYIHNPFSVLIVAFFAGLTAALYLKPWHNRHPHELN